MTDYRRILATSALPYANGPIHLGHLAGAYLPADVFVRYHRLKGDDVVYICGSDEHGAAIVKRAMADGVTPQEIVDRYHAMAQTDFAAVRDELRPLRAHLEHGAPRDEPRVLPGAREEGHVCHQDGDAALRPAGEDVPRRPLRDGDVPALREPERLRRSVREVRDAR